MYFKATTMSNYLTISSDNGLAHIRRLAIIYTNVDVLEIEPLGNKIQCNLTTKSAPLHIYRHATLK